MKGLSLSKCKQNLHSQYKAAGIQQTGFSRGWESTSWSKGLRGPGRDSLRREGQAECGKGEKGRGNPAPVRWRSKS